MPRLTPVSWKVLVAVFEAAGFSKGRQRGSHLMMIKDGILRPVVIPKYDEIGIDIIKKNLKTAGLSREQYFDFLNRVHRVR